MKSNQSPESKSSFKTLSVNSPKLSIRTDDNSEDKNDFNSIKINSKPVSIFRSKNEPKSLKDKIRVKFKLNLPEKSRKTHKT